MRINEDLAIIHAYLCADGYVIKNPETQKQKYYNIGFRNTNLVLLKDFQDRLKKFFGIAPYLIEGERCRIGSKKLYHNLTEEFGSFYSWEWNMPRLNKKLLKLWLRAYFDCEGWVFCKRHQNRHIGLDCVNLNGVDQIISALNSLKIRTIKKYNAKRKIYRIIIYGRQNLINFSKYIGFLHPDKNLKLKRVLEDFIVYLWEFPRNKEDCEKFVLDKLREKIRIKKPYLIRLTSREETNLKTLQRFLKEFYNINSLLNKALNGLGSVYFELSVNKREEVQKLINIGVIPNLFKEK